MITVMRKHHKVLMILITILVCISFSWYWNRTDFSQMGSGVAGRIYEHNVSDVDFQRNSRLLRLASELGMNELAQYLTLGAQTENEAFDNFAWNLMVLRHEADDLGIKPGTEEIAAAVKKLPAFQGANGFDMAKYTAFADHALAPMGFSESQIEQLASDQIALERIQKLLNTGVSVPDEELRHTYEQLYSKMDVAVARFHLADFTNSIQVSDAEVSKYYESHKAELKTEEKREVKFVSFSLTDEQKKLTGRTRIDALQKMADKANDFTDALLAKGATFDAVAQKFQLKPEETGEFTKSNPPPQLKGVPQLAQAAFSLTNEAPNSDAIQGPDGFYVAHLVKIDPARALTLEEARPKIVDMLKQEHGETAMTNKAEEAAQKLRDALKKNEPLEQAAQSAGVQLDPVPPFSLVEQNPQAKPDAKEPPDLAFIRQAVSQMEPGSVSDFVQMPNGGLVVALEKRAPLNPQEFAVARHGFEERALRGRQQVVFLEWLQDRRRAAGVVEAHPHQAPS